MGALTLAISGPTGSGKSTFAAALRERLSSWSPVVLNQDRYFRTWREFPESERERQRTSNHPRAVLWDLFVRDIRALRGGEAVVWPAAGTRGEERGDAPTRLGPTRLLVVEGHLLYNREDLMGEVDLRIFVDTHVHERVVRRLLRDTVGGRTTLDAATAWYRRDVIPNVGLFSESCRSHADLIVPNDRANPRALESVVDWVESRLCGT